MNKYIIIIVMFFALNIQSHASLLDETLGDFTESVSQGIKDKLTEMFLAFIEPFEQEILTALNDYYIKLEATIGNTGDGIIYLNRSLSLVDEFVGISNLMALVYVWFVFQGMYMIFTWICYFIPTIG